MFRRIAAAVFVLCLVSVFSLQSAYADNPNWKADQDALFKELKVKPGETFTRSKEDLVRLKPMLPEKLYDWFARGDLADIKVKAFKYDTSHDAYWQRVSAENKGKYSINKDGRIIDVATGKYPVFVNGEPFPEDEISLDIPDSASKVMYNRLLYKGRTGNSKHEHIVLWVDYERGLERTVQCFWATYYYWGRKGGSVKNPEKLEMRDLTVAVAPFDMAGTAQLSIRTLGTKDDQVYAYIPAIRRVKRLSGANRSDPYMGSEAIFDDAFGWNGLNASMTWTYLGRKAALCWLVDWTVEHGVQMDHNSDGSWSVSATTFKYGFEVPGSKCAKWAPVNSVWAPRKFHVVKAVPKDPYYNAGAIEFWVDLESKFIVYKWTWDRAGEYWKGLCLTPHHVRWADSYGFQALSSNTICDDKLKHATIVVGGCGKLHGSSVDMKTIYDLPKITPRMLTVEKIKMWTK